MRKRWLAVTAAACLGGALVPGRVRGEDKPPDVPPEMVAKFTDILKKVSLAQRPRLDTRMSGEIAEVAKVTGLGAEGVKSLETAAAKAEDAAQAELQAKCLEVLRKQYAQVGAQGFAGMDQSGYLESMASTDLASAFGIHYTMATEQPAWTEALAHALSPEQTAAWEKTRAERQAAASKEIESFLDGQAAQHHEMLAQPMRSQADEIISWLDLSKERAGRITAASKQAVENSLAAWRKSATKSLLENDDATLKSIIKRRWYSFSFDEETTPAKQAVWTDTLAKELTDEERARLKETRGEHRARRVGALGQLLVALLDEKIAFTASQRARLVPVAQRLVQTAQALFPDTAENNYYSLSFRSFYQAAAAARPEEIDPILDETQRKHWQEISHRQYTTNDNGWEVPVDTLPAPTPQEVAAVTEPEDMERMLSDYLRTQAAAHEHESDAALILQAEDATRVARLAEPAAARLRTAAHGAAVADTISWMSSTEQTIRGQVQGATPENIQQRLDGAGRFYYERSEPKGGDLWTAVVNAEMTPAQQTAWQGECDERSRYNNTAIAGFLAAEFDRRFALSAEQWSRLVPALAQAVQDYRSDIGRMFSYADSSRWYLQSYYMFLPINAVPENDLKALLSPQQWDAWTHSSEYSNSASYWQNIQTMHANRTQQKAKAKK